MTIITNNHMELSDLAQQVDAQIEVRLKSICLAEWRKLADGRVRRKTRQVTYPFSVNELMALRQSLYYGADPEAIAATLQTGQINHDFNSSKP